MDKKISISQSALALTMITAILAWGGLWGIFEATVGYLLHLLPISLGWLLWYPVACFFMMNVYRHTRRIEAVVMVGLLSALIKLLNLFLPGRIDRVLNPAVSIVLEAITLAAVLWVYDHASTKWENPLLIKGIAVLTMNTGWRILYALYLLLLVPGWMREISIICSTQALITFFVAHNLSSCLILLGGWTLSKPILRPIKALEHKLSTALSAFSHQAAAGVKLAGAALLIGCSIALELLL
jgi:branched-subunit amino acid transport protein